MSETHEGGKQVSTAISPVTAGSASGSVNEVSNMASVEAMAPIASGYAEASPFMSTEAAVGQNQDYHDVFYDSGQTMDAGLESSEQAYAMLTGEGNDAEDYPLKLFVGQVSGLVQSILHYIWF